MQKSELFLIKFDYLEDSCRNLFVPSTLVTIIEFLNLFQSIENDLSNTPLFSSFTNSFNALIVYKVLLCFFYEPK